MKKTTRPGGVLRRTLAWTAAIPLVAGAAIAAPAAANAAEPLPTPALLYTFDDTSAAVVANTGSAGAALNGVIRGASTLERDTGATGDTGASGKFPGASLGTKSSPYLEIPDGLFEGGKALTVSTWIKWDGRFADQLPWAYIVGSDRLPGDNWGVYFQPTEDGKSKAVANTGAEVKAASDPLKPETWTYITTSVTDSSISYYINGVLVGQEAVAFDVAKLAAADSTFSGLLGRTQWTGDYAAFFPGEFDDFAVYDQALTAAQVRELFAGYTGEITSVVPQTVSIDTAAGLAPKLPSTAKATYASGSAVDLPITWAPVPASSYATPGTTFTVAGTIAGWAGTITATVSVSARTSEKFTADFSQKTGEFRGGATGTLYGLGDEASPTQALVNGAAMTTISQKPPFGTQHPGGDAFNVEDTFFDKWGEELYVYAQDYYPDWPYHGDRRPGDDWTFARNADGSPTGQRTAGGNGVWDYLEVLDTVADQIAQKADDPEKFVFIPFNEPEWIWYDRQGKLYRDYLIYGGQADSFTPGGVSDWKAAWDVITEAYARHGLDRPEIAGPGDSIYMGETDMTEFMKQAKAEGTVPDVYVWHELGGYAWLPDRMAGFRRAAAAAGIAAGDLPRVNITEYGAITDMSSPASLLHWFSSFEAAKVDAQTAYWTASGTMSDNQALVNSANGGWWLFKWYGDLHGSQTVKVTDNEEHAIGAIDEDNRRAQLLFGGVDTGKDAAVTLKGLDTAVLGDRVDVEVREVRVSGTDGQSAAPRVVAALDDARIVNGSLSITVPGSVSTSAYQLVATPASDRDVESQLQAQAPTYTVEAEDTALVGARVRTSPEDSYRASGDRDVFEFTTPASRSDWTVDVAEDGLYRLQVIGAAPGVPAQHALFVDDALSQRVQYGATSMKPGKVQGTARGSAEVYVPLTAGTHLLSLRASEDGTTLLPNAGYAWDRARGVTLDRFQLTRVGDTTNTETQTYPATTFRVAKGAELIGSGDGIGSVAIEAGQRADLYPAVLESGYYDVDVDWAGPQGATVDLHVNGRSVGAFATGTSRVRVHLPLGISEFELFGSAGVTVAGVTTTRAVEGDAAIVRVEAEDASRVTLGGTAAVQGWGSQPTDGVATNGTGTGYVGGLGITDRNPANEGTLTVARGAGFAEAGEYDLVVHYSNDNIEGTHDYNPQVVDAGLDAIEGSATKAGRSTFRYTYLRTNFFEATMPLKLSTADEPIRFGNTRHTLYIDEKGNGWAGDDEAVDGYAVGPNVDSLEFAPFVLDSEATSSVTPTVTSDGGVTADGWRRAPVTVAFTTDAADAAVQYRVAGSAAWTTAASVTVTDEGSTTIEYRAVRGDEVVAGTAGSLEVKLDRVAPVTAVATDPVSGSAIAGAAVTATFTATDSTSGVASTEYSTDAGTTWSAGSRVSFPEVGPHVVQFRSTDKAGNVEASKSVTLTVTAAASAKVTITSADAPTAEGWYRENVLVRLAPAQTGQKVQYRVNDGTWRIAGGAFTLSADGTSKIDHRLLQSNVVVPGSEAQTVINIDKRVPIVSATRIPGSGSGTVKNPIALEFTGADTVSGLDRIEYRINGGQWATATAEQLVLNTVGDYVVSYRALDRAGNASATKSVTAVIKADVPASVKSSVKTAKPGAAVTLTLAGFARWDDVTVTIGGVTVSTSLTDANGAAKVTVRIPAGTSVGDAPVVATGTDGTTSSTVVTVKK